MTPDIRQFYLFSKVSDAALDTFLKGSRVQTLQEGDIIYDVGDEPDWVYLVVEGAVRLEVPLPDGDSLFLGVAPSATLFGEHEALCHTYSVARISAVGELKLLCVPKANFLHLFKTEPEFTQLLAQQLAMSMRMLCLATAHHFNSRTDKKLASLLIHLADRVGEERPEGIHLKIKLSQEELAQMIASTRQTVNKYLQAWRKQGWIGMNQGMIDIFHMAELRELSSEELIKELRVKLEGI